MPGGVTHISIRFPRRLSGDYSFPEKDSLVGYSTGAGLPFRPAAGNYTWGLGNYGVQQP